MPCDVQVVECENVEAELTVHPTAQVYERAYVSLYSRLLPDGTAKVIAAATTNEDVSGWKSVGFCCPSS